MSESIIRLDSKNSSYVIDAAATPTCLYWGRRLPDGLDLSELPVWLQQSTLSSNLDQEVPLSLLSGFGLGWMGAPALLGSRGQQDWTAAFKVTAVNRSENSATLRCQDETAGLEVNLELILDPDTDVLTRRTLVRNVGADGYRIDWTAAAAFAVPAWCNELLAFTGQHTQEFQERRIPLSIGTWSRENRRGLTSHDSRPELIVGSGGFTEDDGRVYGFHLAWSSNHRLLVDSQNDATRQVLLGELLAPGEVVLNAGEAYASPLVYAAFADDGLNGLADRFHRFVRRQILTWPGKTMRPRPVHLNTWEALYHKHEMEDLKDLARVAVDLGVERYVLDDGWFKGRDDDTTSLGDWIPDPRKYPQGLGPLVDYVNELGMEFGLWVEPEMVNPDSELYRSHPDWALHLDGRPRATARNQLVLNCARKDVTDYLFNALDKLLSDHPIGYLKWDHNRDLTAAGDHGAPAYRRHILAVYELIGRLRAAHPDVEIESCAGGGGRIDYGILALTQRVWTSDSNDALERQAIQRGYLRFFPPEIMGAHVGPSPAHTSGRRHTLAFRAATALFGHFGLELDVRHLDDGERSELKAWIETHKRFRSLLHSGRSWRLDRLEPGTQGQGVVSIDGSEALFAIVQLDTPKQRLLPPVRLPGLDASARYRLSLAGPRPPHLRLLTPSAKALLEGTLTVPGAVLGDVGVRTPVLPAETVLLIYLQKL